VTICVTEKEEPMSYRNDFTLFVRKLKSGKIVYYYRTYGASRKRTGGRSTGQKSKAAARQFVIEKIRNGGLITKKDVFFRNYADGWCLRMLKITHCKI
jgi:hypothetical protein